MKRFIISPLLLILLAFLMFQLFANANVPPAAPQYPTGGAATWGLVAGTLSDQTDLNTELAAKADESVVGTSLNADDLELNGAVLQTAAEIPHIDAAQTWTGIQSLKLSRLVAQTSEPTNEAVGDIIRADCDTWDPLSRGGTTDYFMICTAAGSPGTYVGFYTEDGELMVSSIGTPTLLAAELNDTSDPHTLIQREMEGKIISNASGAMHLDVLAAAENWSVIFHVGAANNYVIHPLDSANWYLNGTVLAADRTISNTAPTIGEDIACYSTGGKVFCKSTFPDFVSAAE